MQLIYFFNNYLWNDYGGQVSMIGATREKNSKIQCLIWTGGQYIGKDKAQCEELDYKEDHRYSERKTDLDDQGERSVV